MHFVASSGRGDLVSRQEANLGEFARQYAADLHIWNLHVHCAVIMQVLVTQHGMDRPSIIQVSLDDAAPGKQPFVVEAAYEVLPGTFWFAQPPIGTGIGVIQLQCCILRNNSHACNRAHSGVAVDSGRQDSTAAGIMHALPRNNTL